MVFHPRWEDSSGIENLPWVYQVCIIEPTHIGPVEVPMHIIVTSMTNKAPTALWPWAQPVCILLCNLRHIHISEPLHAVADW